jgi:hypothetical protein
MLWPPPQPAVDVSYFVPNQEYGGRYSNRWHEKVAQEQTRRAAERTRLEEEEAKLRAQFWAPRQ